jgi:hypothetical protein
MSELNESQLEFEDGSYLTHAGEALIARALAGQGPLRFTRVEVGSGRLSPGQDPMAMTQLIAHEKDAAIVAIENSGHGEASISAQVQSVGQESGFFLSEAAVFAQGPGGDEALYAYMLMNERPQWISPDPHPVNTLCTLTCVIVVKNAPAVSAKINPYGFVRVKELKQYSKVGHRHGLSDIAGLEVRFSQLTARANALEEKLDLLISGIANRWEVNFTTLDDVEVLEGVWTQGRIEG